MAVGAPPGFEGQLLYIRADLLRAYAADRILVQVAWGERECRFDDYRSLPGWYAAIVQRHGNVWRRVAAGRPGALAQVVP